MYQTKREGIEMAREATNLYQKQVRQYEEELLQIQKSLQEIEQEQAQTLQNIAYSLLTSTEDEVLIQIGEEIGAPQLKQRKKAIEKEKTRYEARIPVIEKDESYINRDLLIHPDSGKYTLKIKEVQGLIDTFLKEKSRFEFKDFFWLKERGVHQQKKRRTAFEKFWRGVTLANYREERVEADVLEKLEATSFVDCVEDYERLSKQIIEQDKEKKIWEKKQKGVLNLIEEYSFMTDWLSRYEEELLNALREEIIQHLKGVNFEVVHAQIRPAGKILAAKCHALEKKKKYLEDLRRFLQKEIADREERIVSISRVSRKWSKKPYGMLRGNKTKWLRTVPQMKMAGAEKRSHWVQTMHHNISAYDDYLLYSALLAGSVAFLPYDAFSFQVDERMPYEGFSRGVISELAEFRDIHNQERADFSDFKEIAEEVEPYSEDWEQTEAELEEEAAAALAEEEESDEMEMMDEMS